MDKMLGIYKANEILVAIVQATPDGRKHKQTIKKLEKESQGENIENNSKSNID